MISHTFLIHTKSTVVCSVLQRHLKYQLNTVAQVKLFSAVAGHLGRLAHPRTKCKLLMWAVAIDERKGLEMGSQQICGETDIWRKLVTRANFRIPTNLLNAGSVTVSKHQDRSTSTDHVVHLFLSCYVKLA